MLTIKTKNDVFDITFDGIGIINSTNTLLTYKKLFIETEIYIDDNRIKKEDIIYIDELSKMSNFIDLSKKSFLIEMINDRLFENKIINTNEVENIIETINKELNIELLESCVGDTNKIIQILFELVEDQYLNINLLKVIIEYCFKNKKLIIFNNLSWLKIDDLYKYLNEHYFIVIASDVRNYINKIEMLNIISNHNLERNELNSIYDIDKFSSYIEKNISEPFNNKTFNDFITDKKSIKSLKILNLINNL